MLHALVLCASLDKSVFTTIGKANPRPVHTKLLSFLLYSLGSKAVDCTRSRHLMFGLKFRQKLNSF